MHRYILNPRAVFERLILPDIPHVLEEIELTPNGQNALAKIAKFQDGKRTLCQPMPVSNLAQLLDGERRDAGSAPGDEQARAPTLVWNRYLLPEGTIVVFKRPLANVAIVSMTDAGRDHVGTVVYNGIQIAKLGPFNKALDLEVIRALGVLGEKPLVRDTNAAELPLDPHAPRIVLTGPHDSVLNEAMRRLEQDDRLITVRKGLLDALFDSEANTQATAMRHKHRHSSPMALLDLLERGAARAAASDREIRGIVIEHGLPYHTADIHLFPSDKPSSSTHQPRHPIPNDANRYSHVIHMRLASDDARIDRLHEAIKLSWDGLAAQNYEVLTLSNPPHADPLLNAVYDRLSIPTRF